MPHTITAVSRPSRPTDRNAVSTSAPVPIASAWSSLPCNSAFNACEVRRIQKIIQVTRNTARTESEPPNISCCSNVISAEVSSRVASSATLSATAAPIPSQTAGSASRRSLLTR
ncbi:hypothetical protein EHYA_10438 [Embleya hyalina]|uniref:Uncharacterized protein n=1 Tax=Embleya hyalina TaxID=516124 RepID=A0A401Z765_9ACTN|nr:hypothetical protein EHYA_10438 [Embleya hyalina]